MSLGIAKNLHVVNQIVERDLCVRCGACEPACPVDIIRFDERGYPYITQENECLRGCTRCLKVCPGEYVDYPGLDDEMFGRRPHPDSVMGIARRVFVAHATSEQVRREGASGGFVTQLLAHMLETGRIDGALVLGSVNDASGWRPEPLVARSVSELHAAAGSKYLTVPFLRPLSELEEVEGRYAIVALPCYIHAIRKYQRVSPKLRERIRLVIGLYCNVAFEPTVYEEVLAVSGIDPADVENFEFREGRWPGNATVRLRDGSQQNLFKFEEMKDAFNTLKLFYTAPRCNLCTDFSGEYADLSVGDPWLRGADGSYTFPDGWSTVLVRTEAGEVAVDRAVSDGWLETTDISPDDWGVNFEFSGGYKRDFIPKRTAFRRLLGLPAPEYGRALRLGRASGWLPMIARILLISMSRWAWFRKFGLRLAQSPPALAYFRWNRGQKARKHVDNYDRRLAFVRSLAVRDDLEEPLGPVPRRRSS